MTRTRVAFGAALVLALSMPLTAQKSVRSRRSDLELLVLGSGGPRSFGRASTSYLVLIKETPRILVDAGPGAFLEVGKLGIDLSRVNIVLLTHLHIDHSSDIPALFLERTLTADGPIEFKVFGPQGGQLFPSTTQYLKLLFGPGGAYEYENTFGAEQKIDGKDLPTSLDSPENEIVSDGDLRVREMATHHGDCPSIAYRVNYRGQGITFAGDMDASAIPNLQHLALDSDLLVVHIGVLDPPNSPQILYTLHTPPKQLGQAARAARVHRLLLSHISPSIEENRKQVVQSISNSYKGNIVFAYDGMRVPISGAVKATKGRVASGGGR